MTMIVVIIIVIVRGASKGISHSRRRFSQDVCVCKCGGVAGRQAGRLQLLNVQTLKLISQFVATRQEDTTARKWKNKARARGNFNLCRNSRPLLRSIFRSIYRGRRHRPPPSFHLY